MVNVWQIACGERGRYYDDIFLEYDVMFLGPGEPGPYKYDVYKEWRAARRIGPSHPSRVKRFALGVVPGDIILLRKGYHVASIGVARDLNYYYNSHLDDIYGWQLQHSRTVCWQRSAEPELVRLQKTEGLFATRKQIPTFTRVKDSRIIRRINHLFEGCKTRPVTKQPEAPPALTFEEVGERLFAKGLPNRSVVEVIAALQRQQRLMSWYAKQDKKLKRPTEHEIVGHMVLPLLLALGWSEQLLAIEWNHVDLAAFEDTPTDKEKCVLLCEAKQMGRGLQDVSKQAHRYFEKLGLKRCRKILITDGARFYLYQRPIDGLWPERPTGYLNVMRIRDDHLAPKDTSAIETIMALTPRNLGAG
jgi:hypothetical protein